MLRLVLSLTLIATACTDVQFEKASSEGASCSNCSTSVPVIRDVNENYTTPSSNKVDIVFVVDNSKSMSFEQNLISSRLDDFTSKITALDWRIAITSTDVTTGLGIKQGRLKTFNTSGNPKFITKNTPNYASLFESHVKLGDDGNSSEQGVNATRFVIERNEVNWMRSDAQFAAVILSDEDECSDQVGSCMGERNRPKNLISEIAKRYGSQKNFSFHSIVVADQDCKDLQEEQINPKTGNFIKSWIGKIYLELTELTGGITGDICATSRDYTEQLSEMGNLIQRYSDSVSLQCSPVNGTVTVQYASDGSPLPHHVSGNRVIFDVVVPPNTAMTLAYQCQE